MVNYIDCFWLASLNSELFILYIAEYVLLLLRIFVYVHGGLMDSSFSSVFVKFW